MKQTEFIGLMALIMSLTALSIDMMLPALPAIAAEFSLPQATDAQHVITAVFVGMFIGTLFFGPLADAWGRKPATIIGTSLFIIGALVAYLATDFSWLIIGRIMQGIGAAAGRLTVVAIIRDQHKGRVMARMMSFVMMIFILVPALAPALGQLTLYFAGWRMILLVYMLTAALLLIWFSLRQPETLKPSNRRPLAFKPLISAVLKVLSDRVPLGYSLATGFVFAGFVAYLVSSQQIFDLIYQRGPQFPYYFGALALVFGSASFVNSRLVIQHGMRKLSFYALAGLITTASITLLAELWSDTPLPFFWFVAFCAPTFFCIGLLFGNLNALAMEPLGHMAGMGAAVVGMISTLVSVPIGAYIGQQISTDILPILLGFINLGILAMLSMAWVEAGHKSR